MFHTWFYLVCIGVDGGFNSEALLAEVLETDWRILALVLRPQGAQDFVLLPKRWTVDSDHGWLYWCSQLNLDYECLPTASEAFLTLSVFLIIF